jgi:hypothetical protein
MKYTKKMKQVSFLKLYLKYFVVFKDLYLRLFFKLMNFKLYLAINRYPAIFSIQRIFGKLNSVSGRI